MKLSRVVQLTESKRELVTAPSAVHVAFVEVIGELTHLAVSSGHPAAKIMQKMIPTILPDIAEIPPELMANFCHKFADLLHRVADAETTAPPSLESMLDESFNETSEPVLTPEISEGSATDDAESRPAFASQHEG